MTGELRTDLPSSLSGSVGSSEAIPETESLEEARQELDACLDAFVRAGNRFLEAGGTPAEMYQKFQAAVMTPGSQ